MLDREVVERLGELLAKATPGELNLAQNTNTCWEIRYHNWRRNHFVHDAEMAHLFVAAVNALPDLLRVYRMWMEAETWNVAECCGHVIIDTEWDEESNKRAEAFVGQRVRLVRDGEPGEG